jgi:hypothetical protein
LVKALIIGAGAIGRGFLPWAFKNVEFDIYDSSEKLCSGIASQGKYLSFMTINGELIKRDFSPKICTAVPSDLRIKEYDIAFVAVGPRNCSKLPSELSGLVCPIFSVENDPCSVDVISQVLNSDKVFFGVPDVITSSTASPGNLLKDKHAIHTENGILYLEESVIISEQLRESLPEVVWASKSEMMREWEAKLFLHNTPHCVAAYLGYLDGREFLHEGFENPFIVRVVQGVIEELVLSLKRNTVHDHSFLENYADKELKRFSNHLLFDPIGRVAREPLRKLAVGGRLTGALTTCLLAGVNPVYLNTGIAAALNYREPCDKDFDSMVQIDNFGVMNFLKYFVNIEPFSVESKYIVRYYEQTREFLEGSLKCN